MSDERVLAGSPAQIAVALLERIEALEVQVRELRGIVVGMIAKDPSLMALPKDNGDNAPQEEDRRSYVW